MEKVERHFWPMLRMALLFAMAAAAAAIGLSVDNHLMTPEKAMKLEAVKRWASTSLLFNRTHSDCYDKGSVDQLTDLDKALCSQDWKALERSDLKLKSLLKTDITVTSLGLLTENQIQELSWYRDKVAWLQQAEQTLFIRRKLCGFP